ncbi:MAG: hypothetical protein MUO62_09260 [Anaerolineales bacterium]|nr:hypothetical protein [Anaerolineales bacterium]
MKVRVCGGILALLSILSTLFIGIWMCQVDVFPGFGIYSFITIGVVIITGGYSVTKLGTPLMGLTERIAILAGMQWTVFSS